MTTIARDVLVPPSGCRSRQAALFLAQLDAFETESVLGLGADDDGMPLAADGTPPAGLLGRQLAFFDDLLAQAPANSRSAIASPTDADLERRVTHTGRYRTVRRVHNLRWILSHMVEHEAGHCGQINLLAHQLRLLGAGR